MKGEVETQFSLSGLLLYTQPLHSSEQHTRAHLEFSSHFDFSIAELRLQLNVKNADSVMNWCAVAQLKCKTGENNLKKD